jgi:short-subunit dehydrogenase
MDTKMTKDMVLNPKLTAKPEQAARRIYSAYKKKKNVIYVLPVWKWIMPAIKMIPENIFKRMNL